MTPTPTVATSLATLRRRALSLGGANAIDYGLQFLLPVVLARVLPAEAFGEYRLIWLVIMTLMVTSLQMPGVLNYFLPRSNATERRLYVHHTLAWMAFAGALGAFAVSGYVPFLPDFLLPLEKYRPWVPVLVWLYAASTLLDTLPTIDERVRWQAAATLSMTVLRTGALAWAAWATGDLRIVIWVLASVLAFKLAVLLLYVARFHGLGGRWFEAGRFRAQFVHAAPLGLGTALFGLRAHADQWMAAGLFRLADFAAFSVAAVLSPLVHLFRQSVNYVFLPSMSRHHAADDLAGMVELNSRANVMVALFVFPLLSLAFAFAEDLIALVYTPTYVSAAPALRVYSLGMVAMIVEVYSVILLQRDGAYMLRLNLALLPASALVSWQAAALFGLAGAAAGSVSTLYLSRWLTLRRIARTTGLRFAMLQDWTTLGGLLACASLAAGLAWQVAGRLDAVFGTTLHLAVGSAVLVLVYGALAGILFARRRRNPAIVALAQP